MIKATAEEVMDGTIAACLACGEKTDGLEPDAREIKCPQCGEFKVYGLEELLMMGELEVDEE